MISKEPLLIPDLWLSDTLGIPCYKTQTETIEEYTKWKLELKIVPPFFITVKTNLETLANKVLSRGNLRFIQIMNEYKWESLPIQNNSNEYQIRLSVSDDIPEILNLASNSFSQSRFHEDNRVTYPVAEEIKRKWLLNNLKGRPHCFTYSMVNLKNEIVAFNSLLSESDKITIDLICVSRAHQRSGLGSLLLSHSQELANQRHVPLMVGTQFTNTANLLYSKMGFRKIKQTNVWHDIQIE